MPGANLHLTLAFLGELADEHIPRLQACVADIHAAPVVLTIDSSGFWQHNGIVWLGPQQQPAELGQLVAALRQRLTAGGFEHDTKPYVPHITLMRRARAGAVEAVRPAEWACNEFVLAGSTRNEGGSAYKILARWPLIDKCSEPAGR